MRNSTSARGLLACCALAGWTTAALANNELWDLYPSAVAFAQSEDGAPVGAGRLAAYTLTAPGGPLSEPNLPVEVADAETTVTWNTADLGDVGLEAASEWAWTTLIVDDFTTGACAFTFMSELGVRRLSGPEGYRLALRESLDWSGPEDGCAARVLDYFDRASDAAVMPLHVSFWRAEGVVVKPGDTGSVEFTVFHDLRRSRRLLPLQATAELDADPFLGVLALPGALGTRAESVRARLGPLIFKDAFEP